MEGRNHQLFTAAQIVAAGAVLWLLFSSDRPWNAPRYAGTALAFLGLLMIAVARYELGKSFSIRAEAHKLVTTGIYSRICNPIYVAGLIMIMGLILAWQRPAFLILWVAVLMGQTVRARREAKVLEAAFGDQYREYRRKTWF